MSSPPFRIDPINNGVPTSFPVTSIRSFDFFNMEILSVPNNTPYLKSVIISTQPVQSPVPVVDKLLNYLDSAFTLDTSKTNPKHYVEVIPIVLYSFPSQNGILMERQPFVWNMLLEQFGFQNGTTNLQKEGQRVSFWIRFFFPNACSQYALPGIPNQWEIPDTTSPSGWKVYSFVEIILPNGSSLPSSSVVFVQWNPQLRKESVFMFGQETSSQIQYPQGTGWCLLSFDVPIEYRSLDGFLFILKGLPILESTPTLLNI